MKELKIDIRNENEYIRNRFKGVDLISLEDLLNEFENLIFEVERLEERIEDLEQDIEDNYRRIPISEQIF